MQAQAATFSPPRRATTLAGWNDIVGDAFAGCVVDAPGGAFAGALAPCAIGRLRFVQISAQSSKVRRWLRAGPLHASGTALLHLQAAGWGINRQGGHEARIGPGYGALCDPDQPYGIDFLSPYEMFVLQIPLSACEPGFDLGAEAGRALDPKRTKLLSAFMQATWAQAELLGEDDDWQDCVSRTALQLALGAIRPAGAPALASGIARAVLGHIHANLAEPALRTGAIAQALRISPRSVQSVFEHLNTTASAYILRARLRRAANRLQAEPGRASITDIALDCGFNDPAYFARCFRRVYGMAPRMYEGK
jgi:AraC-like DNA-binding protein